MKSHLKLLVVGLLLSSFVLNSPKALAWGIDPISTVGEPSGHVEVSLPVESGVRPPSVNLCDEINKVLEAATAVTNQDKELIYKLKMLQYYYGCINTYPGM